MISADVQNEQRRLGFLRRQVGAVRLVRALDHLALAIVGEQEDLGAEGEQEGILTQREGPAARRKREFRYETESVCGVVSGNLLSRRFPRLKVVEERRGSKRIDQRDVESRERDPPQLLVRGKEQTRNSGRRLDLPIRHVRGRPICLDAECDAMGEKAADEFDLFEKGGARVSRRGEVSHQSVVQRIWQPRHPEVKQDKSAQGARDSQGRERVMLD